MTVPRYSQKARVHKLTSLWRHDIISEITYRSSLNLDWSKFLYDRHLMTFGDRLGIFNFGVIHIKLWKSHNQQSRFRVALKRKRFDTRQRSMRVPLTPLKHVGGVTILCKSHVSQVCARLYVIDIISPRHNLTDIANMQWQNTMLKNGEWHSMMYNHIRC